MMKRLALIPIAFLTLSLASCGGPAGLYPVAGKVLYKGEPAVGASLTFHPESGQVAGVPEGIFPTASVEEDGSFTVQTGDLGPGLAPGRYKVLVLWMGGLPTEAAPDPKSKSKSKATKRGGRGLSDKQDFLPADRLNGRYSNLTKPILTAEVKPERNDLPPFELKD